MTSVEAAIYGDQARSTLLDLAIGVDLNRDGEIEFSKDLVKRDTDNNIIPTDNTRWGRPYRFWVNNDNDLVNYRGMKPSVTSCDGLNPNAENGTQYKQVCEQWDEEPANILVHQTNTSSPLRLRRIENYRDLEDFSPLAIRLGSNKIGKNYRLKLTAEGVSINLFQGNWQAGEKAHSYIYDANKTEAQVDMANGLQGYVGQLNPSTPIILDATKVQRYFDDEGVGRFIFEGIEAGEDDCNQGGNDCYVSVALYRKVIVSGKEIDVLLAENKAYLNLYDVKDLYTNITAGDASYGNLVGDYDAQYFGAAAIKRKREIKANLYDGIERNDIINKHYILLVHGWRMTEYEKISFAETAYKRLYWSGYKGRFGALNWPTGWFDRDAHQYTIGPMELLEIINNQQHYDISESVARRVGRDFIQKLQDGVLHAVGEPQANEYHIFAHSMGNVVVSEALRHDTSVSPFFTSYTSSQAATVAGAFKQDQAPIQHTLFTDYGDFGCLGNTDEMGPEEAWRCYNLEFDGEYDMPPDLYRFDLAVDDAGSLVIRHGPTTDDAMDALVGTGKKTYYDGLQDKLKTARIINFYNGTDTALSAWEFNQLTRPDTPDDLQYRTTPYVDSLVTSRFEDIATVRELEWSSQITEDSANILARFIPARTNALGQSEIDDTTIGMSSYDLEYTDSNQDHSAQFHGYYSEPSPYAGNNKAVRANYWNSLLRYSLELDPNNDLSGLNNNL